VGMIRLLSERERAGSYFSESFRVTQKESLDSAIKE